MTKAAVLARLEDLQRQRERAALTLSAVEGAIQDCQFWLAQLEQQQEQADRPVTCGDAVPVSGQ